MAGRSDLAPVDPLQGVGIGTAAYRGRARVALSPEEAIAELEPGDVLVTRTTSPAYNLVLTLVGGLVTAEGGPMSHAAVLARELGFPAVVGAPGALDRIPDGSMVEVDPGSGRVSLVEAGAEEPAAAPA
jgi:phosphohistidine swiveling domain-containing protein